MKKVKENKNKTYEKKIKNKQARALNNKPACFMRRHAVKKNKKHSLSTRHAKSVSFPFYFGWEIVVTFRKMARLAGQLVRPFKTYQLVFMFSCTAALIISLGLLFTFQNYLQAAGDSTPPVISNVGATPVGTQAVVVTWDTDELANSTVSYSTTSGNFSTSVSVAAMVNYTGSKGQHAVTLAGLTPNITYYYQVVSVDLAGNTGTSNNGGGGFSVSTTAGPRISNVAVQETLNTQTTIGWTTDVVSDSYVYYSTEATLASASQVGITAPLVTSHQVTIQNLTSGTRYYFYVSSGAALDNNSGSYYSLTTTSDSTGPTLSTAEVSPLLDTQAVVLWTTNEKATGIVRYGTASGTYATTNDLDSSFNLTHAVTLTGLTANTKYYFVVSSTDASGNATQSSEQTFTTLETLSQESQVLVREQRARTQSIDSTSPTISSVKAINISSSTATVTWMTDEETNSFVQYGTTTTYDTIVGNWEFDSSHTVILENLESGLAYHYRVVSADIAGNTSMSADATFLTSTTTQPTTTSLENTIKEKNEILTELAKKLDAKTLESTLGDQYAFIQELSKAIPAPLLQGAPKVSSTSTSAAISWTTDKESNSLVALATQQEYERSPKNPYTQVIGEAGTFTKNHTVTLTNLLPSTVYHYQVRTKTEISQETKSVDFTFTTKDKPFEISSYTVDTTSSDLVSFRWTTNTDSSSSVQYIPYRDNVKMVDQAKTVSVTTPTIIHQVEIPDLEAGTIYDVELISQSADGSIVTKTIDAFTTNAINTPPIISQVQTESALSLGKEAKVQTIISWTTNESSTSRVYYRKGVGAATDELPEKTALDTAYTKKHVVVIASFDPGAVYQFKVESVDSSGKTSLSNALTILTPQKEQTVLDVIISAAEQTFGWIKIFKK